MDNFHETVKIRTAGVYDNIVNDGKTLKVQSNWMLTTFVY